MAGESKLQKRIISQLESEGFLVLKVILCNKSGWPDLQILKNKKSVFIEVKDKGEEAEPLQVFRHETLRDQGFNVWVVDSWDCYLEIRQQFPTFK